MLIIPPGRMRSSLVLPLLGFLCLAAYVIGGIQAQVTNPDEVSALQEIRNQLVDPLNNIIIWDHGDPCTSNWTGIVCYNVTADDGYLHIKELEFLNMNLSGSLSPQLGNLSSLTILDFMWNSITGSIPKEIGNLKSLELLLLNGNQLTGVLPGELGFLPNLDRIQIDQNKISGSIPKSFAYLNETRHFHMNNNSFSGQIPHELSRLPKLVHFLLDNNNLSGHLPPEFSEMPNLLILQLDNNHFEGTTIPASYGNMSKLLKLSLRNCGLQGQMPDLSKIPHLGYLDLSSNQLSGPLPTNKFSDDMITIILSNNSLTGNVSTTFAGLPRLQMLSLADNELDGSLSSAIWQNRNLTGAEKLILDFHNNKLSSIAGILNTPPNVTLMLQGNPLCSSANLVRYCGSTLDEKDSQNTKNITFVCSDNTCPPPYEYVPDYPVPCFCAVPLLVKYRLKSPGFSDFRPFFTGFEEYLSSGLNIYNYQLDLDTFIWQSGPRLRMLLKLFPLYNPVNSSHLFNASEVRRIHRMFTGWSIPDNDTFGPYELLDFILLDPYKEVLASPSRSGIGKGALAGIILGAIAVAVFLSAAVSIFIHRTYARKLHGNITRHHRVSKIPINIDGLREFTYGEMALATNDFSDTVGQGGYGKVYKGVLDDGTVVAIKRAQVGSLQGEKEFYTEIELLSRLHHRNLVSLLGICNEEGEQMLVYEFMPNGNLREHLSAKPKQPLSFAMRMKIALESAKGILYLHVDADPPIFHRDIKASNILLDSKFTAKVADFGLSRLAPIADTEGFVPSHVSTVVKGTPGYLDPEYLITNQMTDKSDVYSLGVVFLELLTGMHPILHGKNIVREVNLARQSGSISSVIDQQMGPHPSECAERFMNLALKCCQDSTDARPPMIDVVRELEDISSILNSDSGKPKSSAGRPVRNFSSATTSSSVGRDVSPATSRNLYVSSDVSGSDLISGVIPAITPR